MKPAVVPVNLDSVRQATQRVWSDLPRRLGGPGAALLDFLAEEAWRSAPEASPRGRGGLGASFNPNIGCVRGAATLMLDAGWQTCFHELLLDAGLFAVHHHLEVGASVPDPPYEGVADVTWTQTAEGRSGELSASEDALRRFFDALTSTTQGPLVPGRYSLAFGHGFESVRPHPGLPGGGVRVWDILDPSGDVIGRCVAQAAAEDPSLCLIDRVFFDAIQPPSFQHYRIAADHGISSIHAFLEDAARGRDGCHEVLLIVHGLAWQP